MNDSRPSISKASFRDPSGFIFKKNGRYYRQINKIYQSDYDRLMDSGLFKSLTKSKLLINHQETDENPLTKQGYKVILPEQLDYISYPYEWCFSQLKDAALLTLKIQKTSLEHGLSMKDSSAYNIQFVNGRPLFIDTLSFEVYQEKKPWVAYRQFCQHFLAPLALMSKKDIRFGKLSQLYLDGIPLDLASSILPKTTRLSIGLGAHIHLHARSLERHADTRGDKGNKKYELSKARLLAIVNSLEATVNSLKLPDQKTEWGEYYQDTNYSRQAFQQKKKLITKWISLYQPESVWDAGANDGSFSRLASSRKIQTLATDIDPLAIEKAYLTNKKEKDLSMLPLIIDLTNPSPAIGWSNQERMSFLARTKFDMGLCLAFIHHLAIANNLPFSHIAELFSQTVKYLCIEFVPKEDSNAQRLLVSREDIFINYNIESFKKDFSIYFQIKEKIQIQESKRTLYLMENKQTDNG